MKDYKRKEEIRKLFLALWDKAVGNSDYDKQQWMELEALMGLNNLTDSWPPPRDLN